MAAHFRQILPAECDILSPCFHAVFTGFLARWRLGAKSGQGRLGVRKQGRARRGMGGELGLRVEGRGVGGAGGGLGAGPYMGILLFDLT